MVLKHLETNDYFTLKSHSSYFESSQPKANLDISLNLESPTAPRGIQHEFYPVIVDWLCPMILP